MQNLAFDLLVLDVMMPGEKRHFDSRVRCAKASRLPVFRSSC